MSKNKIVNETVLKHLKKLYISMTSIKHQNYKIIDDKKFVYLPTIHLQDEFGLSAFQQRNILKELELEGFIGIKLGHKRKRYFTFNEKRNKPKNIDKIRQMNSEELAKFLQETFDPDEERFGCYSCTCYETHHYPKDCGDCYWLNIGGSISNWLEQEVEE